MNFIKERYDLNDYLIVSITVNIYPNKFCYDFNIDKVCEVIITLVDINVKEKLIITCHKVDYMKYSYNDVIFLGLRQLQEAAIIEKDGKMVIDFSPTYGTDAEPYPDFERSNLLFQCEKVTYEAIDITDLDSQNY